MNEYKAFNVDQNYVARNTPSSYITESNALMSSQLEVVNNNICAGTQLLSQSLGAVEQAVRGAARKQRRSMVNEYMAIQPDGLVLLVTYYNDGTYTCEQLMFNVAGNWQIYRMKFPKLLGKTEWFVLSFPTIGTWIVGKASKNTGSGLYDYFLRAGIKFNPAISKSRIQRVLYEGLVTQIEGCTEMLIIPALAGWYEGKYQDAESYQNLQRGDYPQLPIFEKHFLRITNEENKYNKYFEAIRSIRDMKARLCVMILPFAGILSSVFYQENLRIPLYINFVWFVDTNPEVLSAFFKIFNREKLSPVSVDCSAEKIATILQRTNDEILFVNALTRKEEVAYRKKKIRCAIQDIIDLTLGESGSYRGYECEGTWGLAMISKEFNLDNHAVNIFVENNFFTSMKNALMMQERDTLPAVLTNFTTYVENNFLAIKEIIREERKEKEPVQKFVAIMMEILERFWLGQGVNLKQRVDLPIYIDAKDWVRNDIFMENEWRQVFIEVVRKEIVHFYLVERNVSNSKDLFTIYFDQQFLWFPTLVLEHILGQNGLLQKKHMFLLELQKAGVLVTENVGLTRRLQVDGKRREYYQIRREFFEEIGKPSIVDIGKRC